MQANEAIIRMMNKTGARQADVARSLGVSRASVSKSLKDGGFRLDTFVGLCQAMGYDVIVKKGDDEYEIDMSQKGIDKLP